MAREAGVSTATVSRVVHGQDRVRPSTRQRVLEVIEALGYVPDSSAQSMVRRRKEVIGLVAIESRSPDTDIEQEGLLFMEEVLRGVESPLSQVG
ncbi:MAG: LacI family DNA-binding transcriptional regulator, partial [Acidimicrobiia bacterium]